MGSQTIYHKSKVADIVMNFAASENNLSWSFTAENDGEIYEDTKTNVASYTINGGAVTLPFALIGGSSYSVAITKTTNGQTASISLRTRRAIDKSVNISVPDFGDVSITSTFVLLSNTGANGQVVVLENNNCTSSNYAGAGVFTNSIIRATINLPNIAIPSGNTTIQWLCCIHGKYNGDHKVVVMGNPIADNSTYRGKFICLIDKQTLVVTNLDGVIDSYTYIAPTPNPGGSYIQNAGISLSENFVSQKILLGHGNNMMYLDLTNKTLTLPTNLSVMPFLGTDVGFTALQEYYYNPIDSLYAGTTGMFNEQRAQHNAANSATGLYMYQNNKKLGTSSYWGRWKGYDKNGLSTTIVENAYLSGIGSYFLVKKNTIFIISTTYVGFTSLINGSVLRVTHTDKTWTALKHGCYLNDDGLKWVMLTNTSRLIFSWFTLNPDTITQGYYDLPAVPIWACNDNILISL